MTLPILDLSTSDGRAGLERKLRQLRASASAGGQAAQAVARIIEDVRRQGDKAVVRYMRRWTDPDFSAANIPVGKQELTAALRKLDRKLHRVLETSIDHVWKYQEHILPKAPKPLTLAGATLGLRFVPVDSVGLAVPGGRAAYPSSLIMLAAPALAAGIRPEAISVVSPPPTRRAGEPSADVSPLVMATCALLGLKRVYRIGGAQAIAALALGTSTVQAVDMIVGPGNVYVQLAKQQLAGRVGIDGFYGPSEIVTLADDSADIRGVAADLIAQAEHDPGKCFLVCWSRKVIQNINGELARQLMERQRQAAITSALRRESTAILVKNVKQALEAANALSAEHVNLAVRDPQALLSGLRHGGEIFLGDQTPVAAGDYYAGPSHCLPTGTTARFASGVSVYTFLRRSGTVWYRRGLPQRAITDIALLAEAEGLDGHAHSVRVRRR